MWEAKYALRAVAGLVLAIPAAALGGGPADSFAQTSQTTPHYALRQAEGATDQAERATTEPWHRTQANSEDKQRFDKNIQTTSFVEELQEFLRPDKPIHSDKFRGIDYSGDKDPAGLPIPGRRTVGRMWEARSRYPSIPRPRPIP